jgi:nucleotide-binding universal stress UspA family protein
MHTIIVPTDFSDTSKNALRFAVKAAAEVKDAHILLYNVYEKGSAGSDGTPLHDENDGEHKIIDLALNNLKAEMLQLADVTISCFVEEDSSFINSLERFARYQKADLIVMGITGSSTLEQIFIGSNSLKMVEKNVCPVMIVPPDAQYKGIKNVALATDLKNVIKTTPVKPLQSVLDLFNPFVHVVNVDSDHFVEVTEAYKKERKALEAILTAYKQDFYFIRMFDFVEAISQFAEDRNIDAIITIRRSNSFLSNIFKSSHTKKLAYHSSVPIVVIHE